MSLRIPATALPDPPAQAEFVQQVALVGGYLQVLNNSAIVELLYGPPGRRENLEAVVLSPGSYSLGRSPAGKPLAGVRAQNAVAGAVSTIQGYFWDETSPSLTFVGVATPGTTVGALTPLFDELLAAPAATFDATGLPGTANTLYCVLSARLAGTALQQIIDVNLNGDFGANYNYQNLAAIGAAAPVSGSSVGATAWRTLFVVGTGAPAGRATIATFVIADYAGTTFQKLMEGEQATPPDDVAANQRTDMFSGVWRNTGAINRVTLTPAAGTFDTGSRFTIWGF